MSVREEQDVINSKQPCQTAWRIHSEMYMEMRALWFTLTGYSHCCFQCFSKSFHSRWSISALLILSINLKHENNNTATSHRIFLYALKGNPSDQWSVRFCHHLVLRRCASCCGDFLVSHFSRKWTESQHQILVLQLEWTFWVVFCKPFFPFLSPKETTKSKNCLS